MTFSVGTLFAIPIPAFTTPGEVIKVTMGGKRYTLQAKCDLEGLKNFELFNDLPRELKTKIWKFAADTRVITAVEIPKIKSTAQLTGDKNAVEFSTFKFEGAFMPSIFQACKEVGELAAAMGYRPMFQTHGSSKAFYFNPGIDVLDIYTQYNRTNIEYSLCDRLELSKVLVNPLELQVVQQLHFSAAYFDLHYADAIKDINSMTSLKVLHLHERIPTFPTCPEFSLKLDFENLEDKGVVPIAKIPGNHLINKEAMKSVYYWVPRREQQDHLIHLWKLFAKAIVKSTTSNPFPATVKLELTYVANPV